MEHPFNSSPPCEYESANDADSIVRPPDMASDIRFGQALNLLDSPREFEKLKKLIRAILHQNIPFDKGEDTRTILKLHYPKCLRKIKKALPTYFNDDYSLHCLRAYCSRFISNSITKEKKHQDSKHVQLETVSHDVEGKSYKSARGNKEEASSKRSRIEPPSCEHLPRNRLGAASTMMDDPEDEPIENFLYTKCHPPLGGLAPVLRRAGVKRREDIDAMRKWGRARVRGFLREASIVGWDSGGGHQVAKDAFTEEVFLVALGL